MGFSVVVDIEGALKRFDTLADSAGDLEKPLAIWGGAMRKKAIAIVKAQDFPPLAESTIEKRAQKGLRRLERKLTTDLKRASGRARGKARREGASSLLAGIVGAGSRGSASRRAVLAEFQQRHQRGLKDRVQGKTLSLKQMASLGGREKRAVEKAVGAPILGGFVRTYVVIASAGAVTIRSSSHEHITEPLNKGGTVGHGAKLPERDTLPPPTEYDLALLESILIEHHLLPAFNEAI